ncbi:beta-galactosidase [Segetibacter sp. 3557_3]|uniref:glycoside hydrolase family 2 protein n=1 Tax=Segetibacter sp. 3557_3 TaxID=2547429 RepID=UPI001058893E|nr:sugar-binding domain-containing protein [Segetibacter sp. 3557_3]TDH29077.1 beta-galactosidase [Segetibacter sp. 3557_3]
MLKKFVFLLNSVYLFSGVIFGQGTDWKMVPGKISSPWAEKVNPKMVHAEYPRPQMVRGNWKNLNGLWDYSILPKDLPKPNGHQGSILVPFAVESALSGVGKTVGKDSMLWYRTEFTLTDGMKGKNVLLHFGAVDWRTEVYVNGRKVGTHDGGYDPFSFDITDALKKGTQQLEVSVWDPSDRGPQPRGKQVTRPNGIWYTPVTGIWQTVWIEGVPKTYIANFKQTPDIDKQTLSVQVDAKNLQPGDRVRVTALDGQAKADEQFVTPGQPLALSVKSPKLWAPENPFLYDLLISIVRNGKTVDEVKSYFAMRKISMKPDANGMQRMLLNDKFVFQFGPLDQGWWPDGLYTAPSAEALTYDVDKTKQMGFNMIRKHVKVEPAIWYNYCDKVGMLVWQDMPSGDLGAKWNNRPGMEGDGDMTRSPESENIFRSEWKEIMDDLHNFPSIVVWVPFNEAWGQFKTTEITNWTMNYDPSRLVNSASGGNFHETGHIMDLHNYPGPAMPKASLFGKKQAIVLGEYGGLGLPIEEHTWQDKNNWGYRTFRNADTLFTTYASYIDQLVPYIQKGLSAAVYTQTTDVEVETNGLMTYDRKVMKIPEAKLKAAHEKLYAVKVQ